MDTIVFRGDFAGWSEFEITVDAQGWIAMDRFGSAVQPDEAEKAGVALIQAAAISRERKPQKPAIRATPKAA